MHRLFSATLASAMAAAFLFAGPAAIAKSSGSMSSAMTTHHSTKMKKHSCPAGEHWIKGYMRNGKKVHGYCRK